MRTAPPGARTPGRARRAAARHATSRAAGGIVIVEAACVLPLLVTLLLFIVEVYFFIGAYRSVSHSVREAVLTGAFAAGVQTTSYTSTRPADRDVSLGTYKTCHASTSRTGGCAHVVMHWRIRRLIESQAPRLVTVTDRASPYFGKRSVRIESTATPSSGGVLVSVRLSGGYDPLFRFFRGVSVRAAASTYHFAG